MTWQNAGRGPEGATNRERATFAHLQRDLRGRWPTFMPVDGAFVDLVCGYTGIGSQALTANRVYFMPCWVPVQGMIHDLGANVTSGIAGNIEVGVYAARESDGWPLGASPLASTGSISTLGTGWKGQSVDLQVEPGLMWLAVIASSTPTVSAWTNPAGALPWAGLLVSSANVSTYAASRVLRGTKTFPLGGVPTLTGSTDYAPRVWGQFQRDGKGF